MVLFFEIPLVIVLIFLIISAVVLGEGVAIISSWMPTIALTCIILFAIFVLIEIIAGFDAWGLPYIILAISHALRGALISYNIYRIMTQITVTVEEVEESDFFALIGFILSFTYESFLAILGIAIIVFIYYCASCVEICFLVSDLIILAHIISIICTIAMFRFLY